MKIAYNPKTAAALTVAPSNNDITFDLPGLSIYVKGVKFDGKAYSIFKKYTSATAGGYNGLVPAPSYNDGSTNRFLKEDGTWGVPEGVGSTIVSSTASGLAPKIGTAAASTVTTQADEWVLTSTKGATPTWRKLPTNAFLNYYRPILVNGTSLLGNNNTALNIAAGTNINLTTDAGKVTINNGLTKVSQLTNDSGYLTNNSLNNYVTLDTNLTITGVKTFSNNSTQTLILKGTATYSTLKFQTPDYVRTFGINKQGNLFITPSNNWNEEYLIWHSGNDGHASGLDADTLDGKHLSDIFHYKGWQSVSNLEDADNATIGLYKLGASELNIPKPYGHLISFIQNKSDGYGGMQLYSSNNQELYYRNHWKSNYSAWRQLAFIDSNITGNAATADKLKNKVQLWGNDFDGSSDVNGVINFSVLGNTPTIKFANGEYIDGYGNIRINNTSLWHMDTDLGSRLIAVQGTGKVGIGTTNPKSKLDVNGSISNKDIINCYLDGTVNRLTMRMVDNVGMVYAFNESESGYKKLLIGRNDGTTITITENGNVGIGTYYPLYKLDVAGTSRLLDNLTINNNKKLSFKSTDGTDIDVLTVNTYNDLAIGLGISKLGYYTYIDGKGINFRTGNPKAISLIIAPSGNVTIGASNLAGSNYKLYVDGNTNINGSLTASTFLGNLDWSYITNKPTSFTPAAHSHNELIYNKDLRNESTIPNDYNKSFKFVGIKETNAIGLASLKAGYVSLIGWRGYTNDGTGPLSWELASGDNRMYVRSGYTTVWSNWSTIAYTTDTYPTKQITTLTGYTKATSASDLVTTDTLNIALGKLEYKADIAYSWYRTITEDDTDEIINKWDEVVDFVNGLEVDLTEEFVTRKTGLIITGLKNFNTASNSVPLKISRAGSNTECLSIGINDTSVLFNLLQDETIASYIFTGTWTNTGDGGDGTKPGTAYVLFNLRDNDKNIYLNNGTTTYTVLHSGIAYINNGTITINGKSITPLTTHQSLANYVTLNTALTITGSKLFSVDIALNHNSTKSSSYALKMCGTSDTYKYLYAKGNDLYFDGATFKGKIWREDNDGSGSGLDADLLDGIDGSVYFASRNSKNIDFNQLCAPNTYEKNGLYHLDKAWSQQNAPFLYGTLLAFNSNAAGIQLASSGPLGTPPDLKYRKRWLTGFSDWKTIAFTDSDITGNAATASKLQTPRKIWGNNFDGTADINGDLIMQNGRSLIWKSTSESNIPCMLLQANNNLAIGGGVKASGARTIIYGGSIELTTNSTAVHINNAGNVGIGTTSPTYKLHVKGDIAYEGALYMVGNKGEFVDSDGTSRPWYGIHWNDLATNRHNKQMISNYYGMTFHSGTSDTKTIAFAFAHGNGDTYKENVTIDGSGNTYIGGITTSTGFKKQNSSDSYVLLGGGGHKAISDFLLKSEIANQELSANLTTITKELTVTQDWMDTGIAYNNLPANGTYVVLVYVHALASYMWECYWSGVMTWHITSSTSNRTNDEESDEIILHRSGHAYHNTIYLRTKMTKLTSNGGTSEGLKLLIAANKNLGAAYTYTFKFKRII